MKGANTWHAPFFILTDGAPCLSSFIVSNHLKGKRTFLGVPSDFELDLSDEKRPFCRLEPNEMGMSTLGDCKNTFFHRIIDSRRLVLMA